MCIVHNLWWSAHFKRCRSNSIIQNELWQQENIVYLIYYIYDRIFQPCYLHLKLPNTFTHQTSLHNMHHDIPALPTKVKPISTLSGLSAPSTNNVLECPVTIWGCDLLMKFRARVSDKGFSGSILPSTGP